MTSFRLAAISGSTELLSKGDEGHGRVVAVVRSMVGIVEAGVSKADEILAHVSHQLEHPTIISVGGRITIQL
jgi:hypothetical protein